MTYLCLLVCFLGLQGNVLIFAPKRGKTFEQFKELLHDGFLNVVEEEKYDQMVWDLHLQVNKDTLFFTVLPVSTSKLKTKHLGIGGSWVAQCAKGFNQQAKDHGLESWLI